MDRRSLATFFALHVGKNKNLNKFNALTNFVSSQAYELFCGADDCDVAIEILKSIYHKKPNEIFPRHKQQSEETFNLFTQSLQSLSKDCQFREVSTNE